MHTSSEPTLEEVYWQFGQQDSDSDREAFLQEQDRLRPNVAAELRQLLQQEAAANKVFGKLDESPESYAPTIVPDEAADKDAPTQAEETDHIVSRLLSPGSSVGPYKLLEAIGEGGMGVVYLAQQSKPVRRKVALKIIKPGMDSKQVIARFEAERQALAMMEHPNIAKVLDAGTTETGLPFFAMELVRGIPITQYCDRKKVTVAKRLDLFCDAANAIQHAHNKGIIHRDIKPSNVLVTEQDGRALVKIIDFGIAKALTDNLTDKTLFTGMFQLVGTPSYMSPEQASLSNVDVDVRSDVYSLGVLLYELLSGALPIQGDGEKDLSFEELRQKICDTQPLRPSKRLSTVRNEHSTIAEHRGVDLKSVPHLITNELDWIVMKALEKDRKRRYQSARELGEDVRRYLDGDAVEAMPPSLWYGFKKRYQKHRLAVLFTLGLCISMVAAVVGTSLQAFRAMEAEQLAESRLQAIQHGQNKIKLALQDAKAQRDKASESYEQARAAVKQLLQRVATQEIKATPAMNPVREKLLTDAVHFYTKLAELDLEDARNFAERAKVNQMRGKFSFVRPDLEKAIDLDPQNAEYHHLLGNFLHNCLDVAYRSEPSVALKHAKMAVELDPSKHYYHASVAEIFNFRLNDHAKAAQHFRAAGPERPMVKLQNLIMADRAAGNHETVVQYADEVDADSVHAQVMFHRIAESHMALGEFQKALEMQTKALESARRHMTDKANHFAIYLLGGRGAAHKKLGQYEEALRDYEAVIALTPYRSYTYKSKALMLYLLGRKERVIDTLRKSLELNPEDVSAYFSIHPDYFLKDSDEKFAKECLAFMTEGIGKARASGLPDDLAALLLWRSRLFLALGDSASAHADRFELGTLIGDTDDSEFFTEKLEELDRLIEGQTIEPTDP